jgi:hypothetical protein
MLTRKGIAWRVASAVIALALLVAFFGLWERSAKRQPADGPIEATLAPAESHSPPNHEASPPARDANQPSGDRCSRSNHRGKCTATEAALLSKDPSGRCYECMTDKGCIDDAPPNSLPGVKTYGDTGLECGDLSSAEDQRLCLDALSCVLATNCTRTQSPQKIAASDNCYCGDESGTNCVAGKAAGACKLAYEAAARSAVPWDVIRRMANFNVALGKANTLVQCAVNNSCSTCL